MFAKVVEASTHTLSGAARICPAKEFHLSCRATGLPRDSLCCAWCRSFWEHTMRFPSWIQNHKIGLLSIHVIYYLRASPSIWHFFIIYFAIISELFVHSNHHCGVRFLGRTTVQQQTGLFPVHAVYLAALWCNIPAVAPCLETASKRNVRGCW